MFPLVKEECKAIVDTRRHTSETSSSSSSQHSQQHHGTTVCTIAHSMIRRCEGERVGQPEHREPSLRPRQLTAIYADRAGTGPKARSSNSLIDCIIVMMTSTMTTTVEDDPTTDSGLRVIAVLHRK